METAKFISDIVQALVLLFGAIWAYRKFFKEGVHRPRIELDVDCNFLGRVKDRRVAAFRVLTHNRGVVDFRFDDIRVRILGIRQGEPLNIEEVETMRGSSKEGATTKNTAPYLDFPEKLTEKSISIISRKSKYYFVRPGVSQKFSYVTSIPANWEFVLFRVSFKYPTTNQIHTAERAFIVEKDKKSEQMF